ncbi:hypothetical protein VNO77_05214 [Canavalia gladiata]|uniref:Periaxin n=2 Tax=Canavalia gladiata TaxID=3824 RepID=A0AAN9MXX9_CANGL
MPWEIHRIDLGSNMMDKAAYVMGLLVSMDEMKDALGLGEADGGERNGMEGMTVGIEGIGSGGRVTCGTDDGIVGILLLGSGGCVVGREGCANVGIVGKGGRFGIEGIFGTTAPTLIHPSSMASSSISTMILGLVVLTIMSATTYTLVEGARNLQESTVSETQVPQLPKPELPPLPKVAELPKPELPKIPEFPKPEFPKVPELPKGEVPELKVPEMPKPELPKVPELPKAEQPEVKIPELPKPEVPKVPELPKIPELPKVPEMPNVPEFPKVPQIPKPFPTTHP